MFYHRKNYKLCLVHSPCLELQNDRLEPPLGLLYISSYVESLGFSADVVDLSSVSYEELEHHIPDGYHVYGFSTYSVNYNITNQLMKAIQRRNPNAVMVAGGPHATALPKDVSKDGYDVVVTAEGEVAMANILIRFSQGQDLPKIMSGEPVSELDALPFPNYDKIDLNSYSREVNKQKSVSLLSSRGCPYPCSFCNSNILGAGKPIRYRSGENLFQEISRIKSKYGISSFRFQDDMFTLNLRRIRSLTPYLKKSEIQYRCFARVNTMSEEMADLLVEGGCVHASFGVESGSPKILGKGAMSKAQTPQQIQNGLKNANKAGIKSRIFLIVGFPGETDDTIQETLSLVKDCPWDEFSVYPLIAYPGTPLHDRPEDFGITYVDKNYSDYLQIGKNFKAGFTIRTQSFDEHKVLAWRDQVRDELIRDGRTWAGNSDGFK